MEARRLEGSTPLSRSDFSYSVVPAAVASTRRADPTPDHQSQAEKRLSRRQRTRLRTGKIIDAAGRFLTECLVFDRSPTGSRLRLPAGVALPASTFQFYDDQQAVLQQAEVVWRAEQDLGVRLRASPDTPRSHALAEEMRRRYYALSK